jgi:excisionase family DNA binding protein
VRASSICVSLGTGKPDPPLIGMDDARHEKERGTKMVMESGTRYISVKEFLESLDGRLSKNTVYQGITAGTIPSIRISRRRILVPADALDRMLETQNDTGG